MNTQQSNFTLYKTISLDFKKRQMGSLGTQDVVAV